MFSTPRNILEVLNKSQHAGEIFQNSMLPELIEGESAFMDQ